MESLTEFLRYLIVGLEALHIPYAFGGSIASMAYGEARSTRDIDVVLILSNNDIGRLREIFPVNEFYFDDLAAKEAVREQTQFNIIHAASGLKVDIYLPGDVISRSQVENARVQEALPGIKGRFSPPEELIVKKLSFYSAGGGDRHVQDILAMFEISGDEIDVEKVSELAKIAGMDNVWKDLRARLGV